MVALSRDHGLLPIVFHCSGSSNAGQMTNAACVELFHDGKIKVGCIAAMGAKVEPLIAMAREDRLVICIDGCPTRCASKTLKSAGVEADVTILVTTLGIEKKSDMRFEPKEKDLVKRAISECL